MGNVLGVGNRPRQGRAVLEILALLYVLRRMGNRSSSSSEPIHNQQTDDAAATMGMTPLLRGESTGSQQSTAEGGVGVGRNNSRRPSIASSTISLSSTAGSSSTPLPSLAPQPLLPSRVLALLNRSNHWLRQFHPLQVVLGVLIGVHVYNNLALLLGLNAPHHSMTQEPDMHYTRNFAQVRWLLTSLDAATLSTLKVRIAPLRHALTFLLSIWYLIHVRRAENQVNAFRRSMTHEALRACWEKGSTPVLSLVDKLMRKRPLIDLELVSIPSPDGHPIECRLFYNKTRAELATEKKMLLDYPGGGFISMSPAHHADYLSYIAITLGIPVLSVNYRKAPEFPFPCGFEDAWYVYKAIVDSNGGALGINVGPQRSDRPIRIAVAGDSAGGNLTAAVTIKSILTGTRTPDGIVLIYPVLDLGTANFWRESSLPPTDHVVKARPYRRRGSLGAAAAPESTSSAPPPPQPHRPDAPKRCADAPSSTFSPSLPTASDPSAPVPAPAFIPTPLLGPHYSFSASTRARTSVDAFGVPQLSSRALYTQDGVLPLKYMQLIADCYFKNGGDPVNNPLISPAAAGEDILARFPPIYAHAGSVDPLVDDLLRFGARCVQARKKGLQALQQGPLGASQQQSTVHVCLLPKVSHAYMHVTKFLPEAQLAVDLTATWIGEILGVACNIPEIPERMERMKVRRIDLESYQLTQPKSKAQSEAEAAEEGIRTTAADAAGETTPAPSHATVGLLPASALSSKL